MGFTRRLPATLSGPSRSPRNRCSRPSPMTSRRDRPASDHLCSLPLAWSSAARSLPNLAWVQIVLIVALLDNSVFAQKPEKAAGDVIPFFWVRYPDVPGFSGKEFKLNAERNNGRAAMMGIFGMIIHEALTGNPVWPIPVPPQPVLEIV